MKISRVSVKNFCSAVDLTLELNPYSLLVGPNNSGKSTIINAIRTFYGDRRWSQEDWPRVGSEGDEAWVELEFSLTDPEYDLLAEKYRIGANTLRLRRYLKSSDRCKANQSNIYGYNVDGEIDKSLFYGMKSSGLSRLGRVIHIPALSVPGDHLKTSGPSALRNVLNFVFKRAITQSAAYQGIQEAIQALNEEAQEPDGILADLRGPINEVLLPTWGIELKIGVNELTPENLTKNLIDPEFVEPALGDEPLELSRHGHGFQRSMIFELLRIADQIQAVDQPDRDDFAVDFTLILFEEPEAFLHPDQQSSLSLSLRSLGGGDAQQVLASTHSPLFVGRSADQLSEIIRLAKPAHITQTYQVRRDEMEDLYGEGRALRQELERIQLDPDIGEQERANVERFLASEDFGEEVALQEEKFRHQMWLAGDRAELFFAAKVLLCEGPSERVLIDYLLSHQWSDLRDERVFVVDALGKYNMHRFVALFERFGIPFAMMIDGDGQSGVHPLVNEFLADLCRDRTLGPLVIFETDIEGFLEIECPRRRERKPISILRHVAEGRIDEGRIQRLKEMIVTALGVDL